jgi:hypothetical protein
MIVVKRCQGDMNYLQSYPYLVNVKRYLVIVIGFPISISRSLTGYKVRVNRIFEKFLSKKRFQEYADFDGKKLILRAKAFRSVAGHKFAKGRHILKPPTGND